MQRLAIVMLLSLTACAHASAQSANANPQAPLPPAADLDQQETKEIVDYRLTSWKTVHSKDAKDAEKMIATLKQLKCEVKTSNHGDHIDITYQCPKWKRMSLKDHKTAHQWEAWLKKYGFETKHTH